MTHDKPLDLDLRIVLKGLEKKLDTTNDVIGLCVRVDSSLRELLVKIQETSQLLEDTTALIQKSVNASLEISLEKTPHHCER